MDLKNFGRNKDYIARDNELMSLLQDHMCTWDVSCHSSNARTYVHLSH